MNYFENVLFSIKNLSGCFEKISLYSTLHGRVFQKDNEFSSVPAQDIIGKEDGNLNFIDYLASAPYLYMDHLGQNSEELKEEGVVLSLYCSLGQ